MILIFYEIISIPFKLSFEVDLSPSWDILVNAIFLSDILVTFNTAIYLKGNLVLKIIIILRFYKEEL